MRYKPSFNPSWIHFNLLLALITITIVELPTLAQSSSANLPRTARIAKITGKGKVRVDGESPRRKFFAGEKTELNKGDLIFPEQGVRVTILCPNGSQKSVSPGVPSGLGTICPVWSTVAARGTQDPGTAGGINTAIPYLISPRHTLLLNASPLLRWNAVAGASQYTVEVRSLSGTVWKTQTRETQVSYAGKPLTPGTTYSLLVTTNTKRSSQEDKMPGGELATSLDFKILRPSEAAEVRAMAAKLLQSNAKNEAATLMLATYYGDYVLPSRAIAAYGLSQDNYQTYSLTAEAISILESQLQQGKQSATLYRTLGDLYWQSGLIRLAGNAYKKAITKVQSSEDLEEWTLAYYGLGKVYAVLKEPQQTLQCLSQARIGFIFLDNEEKAKELDRQIERLRETTVNSLTR
ncbi:hypothetical protein H6F89_30185 [Cyanobacteria bacterium FACHB-63]|nr:hypothetical protein [Cyanobacteria bacterium FACHB-63]